MFGHQHKLMDTYLIFVSNRAGLTYVREPYPKSEHYDHSHRMAEADRDLSVHQVQPLLKQDTQNRMPRHTPMQLCKASKSPHIISGQPVPDPIPAEH